MNLNYLVIVEKTDTGYSAYVPDLPGCITVGNSKKEIESNIQEAILLHLEGIKEDGIQIPLPHTEAVTMTISKALPSGAEVLLPCQSKGRPSPSCHGNKTYVKTAKIDNTSERCKI